MLALLVLAALLPFAYMVASSVDLIGDVPAVSRALSLGDVGSLESGTLAVRAEENEAFFKAIRKGPLTGLGWGVSYGLYDSRADALGQFATTARAYIHNQYLLLWLRTGLLGLGALAAAFFLSVRGATRWAKMPGDDAWLGYGVVAAAVQLLASSLVGLYLYEPPSIVAACCVLALGTSLGIAARKARTVPNSDSQLSAL